MATVKKIPFELAGADGGPLRGDVRVASRGSGRPAVVICHGFKGFKDWGMFPPLAERLARAGITAISFNFSGSGVGPDGETFSEPERFARDTYLRELEDLHTVCRGAEAARLVPGVTRPSRLGLFGHSRGGGVAVLRAADDPTLTALVTWAAVSTPMRWTPDVVRRWRTEGKLDVVNARTGQVLPLATDIVDELDRDASRRLDILRAAGRVVSPWLIVHGEADESVPVEEGEALLEASAGRAQLRVIANGGHTFGAKHPWQGTTPELDQAMDATVEWFSRYLF